MSFEVKLLVLISLLSVTSITSTRVRNGAYHNIVVEIQKDVPFDDCSNFLLSLEVRNVKFIQLTLSRKLKKESAFRSLNLIVTKATRVQYDDVVDDDDAAMCWVSYAITKMLNKNHQVDYLHLK